MSRKAPPTRSKFEAHFAPEDQDLPATRGMLQLVRTELKAEMRAGFKQVDAQFKQVDAQFKQVDARFDQVDARFDQVDARFHEVKAEIAQLAAQNSQIMATVARIEILVEEQNSRNRVVLDGLTGLWQRQERIEQRVDDVEGIVRAIARGVSR